jgi:hypothetical protein
MFGLFRSAPFQDGHFGSMIRSSGYWKSTIVLGGHGSIDLLVSGGRKAPDPAGLALAHELPTRFTALVPQIQARLFEHYEPYKEAASAGELLAPGPFPQIEREEDVWAHIAPVHVLVAPISGSTTEGPAIEIAYQVAWDKEHVVGTRIQEWHLFELCGSV